jgi:outer membrane immunogenic protein
MIFLRTAILAAVSFILLSDFAMAQSPDAILRRLEAIEANNAALAKENAGLRARLQRLEDKRFSQAAAAVSTRSQPPANALAYAPPAPVMKAPILPDRSFNWTGFHLGIHSGYEMNRQLPSDTPDSVSAFSGWLFGANTGYDYQFSRHWVAGVEVDYSIADIQRTSDHNIGFDTTQIDNIGTARARLGYAWDRYMTYVTGGYAWATMHDHQFIGSGQFPPNGAALTSGVTMQGYAVGAGAQWAATDNLIFKAEYLYLNFGNPTLTFAFPPPIGTVGGTSNVSGSSVKAGVAWLFH